MLTQTGNPVLVSLHVDLNHDMNPGWNHVFLRVQSIAYLGNTVWKLVNHTVQPNKRRATTTIDQERDMNYAVNHVVIVAWNTLSIREKSPNLHLCYYVK